MPRAPPCLPGSGVDVRSAIPTSQALTRFWFVGGTCALVFPVTPLAWGCRLAGWQPGPYLAAGRIHLAGEGAAAACAWPLCWVRVPGSREAC
eukprot:3469198-Prorocentrum_lima.AAC.1